MENKMSNNECYKEALEFLMSNNECYKEALEFLEEARHNIEDNREMIVGYISNIDVIDSELDIDSIKKIFQELNYYSYSLQITKICLDEARENFRTHLMKGK